MLRHVLRISTIKSKQVLTNVALISNIFIWFFCAFITLKTVTADAGMSQVESLAVWIANFGGASISTLIGATIADRTRKRKTLFLISTLLGVFSSLIPAVLDVTITSNALVLSFSLGVSFGLSIPICMEYFTSSTPIESRAQLGGLITFVSFVGAFGLGQLISGADFFVTGLVLATWRAANLAYVLLSDVPERTEKGSKSYSYVLGQRSFLLYFIPWIMFSLVNSLSLSVQSGKGIDQTVVEMSTVVENILAGIFAVVGGLLSDVLGRKRMAITGFVMLGLGYAILGIYPANLVSWYLYTAVDGISWGIFYAVFFMTVWGDLAFGASSVKYYALGGLPYLLSNFLGIALEPYIADAIPAYAIFSFTALFLFLAVIPLMYAPETLPEKNIRDRELKIYVDTAMKTKEKSLSKIKHN